MYLGFKFHLLCVFNKEWPIVIDGGLNWRAHILQKKGWMYGIIGSSKRHLFTHQRDKRERESGMVRLLCFVV